MYNIVHPIIQTDATQAMDNGDHVKNPRLDIVISDSEGDKQSNSESHTFSQNYLAGGSTMLCKPMIHLAWTQTQHLSAIRERELKLW